VTRAERSRLIHRFWRRQAARGLTSWVDAPDYWIEPNLAFFANDVAATMDTAQQRAIDIDNDRRLNPMYEGK
jgi:hypothetical protein